MQLTQVDHAANIRTDAPSKVRSPIDWDAADWTSLVRAGEAMATAHRATGLRTAEKRRAVRASHRVPLAPRVDGDTFLDGAHDAIVRHLTENGRTFEALATDEDRRAFLGGGLTMQTMVDECAARAFGEVGRRHAGRRVDLTEDVAPDERAAEAEADREAREEASAVLAALPERYRRALEAFRANGYPTSGGGQRDLTEAREAALAILAERGHAVDAGTLRGRRARRIRVN